MSFVAIGNIVIVTIIACLGLSLFWSHWTYKVFKPFAWLELRKAKQIHSAIEQTEKKAKDKNRFYSVWFMLNQLDRKSIEGQILIAGVENSELATLCRSHNGERHMTVIDTFDKRVINVTKENCSGEVTNHNVDIEFVSLDDIKNAIGEGQKTTIIKGNIIPNLDRVEGPLAMALIDSVVYDEVFAALNHAYSHLSEGGIIVVHDYNHDWDSVRYAVDKFEASVPESFISLPDMYGSVALVKNKQNCQ